ncbi:helix-turn-helix transcriptional regulator [Tritonibacter mobilis]|uniref:helix-turn-helix transcriptional regulator n=1 Tax=Tritonibacter mobilis TaxID=379347 RepID=UPI0019551453|nr:AlpA family phage regulatory protein [Tritonibacter mobilis]
MAKLIDVKEVCRVVSLSRSQIYALMREGAFPAPVKVGRASRWRVAEIDKWIEALEA